MRFDWLDLFDWEWHYLLAALRGKVWQVNATSLGHSLSFFCFNLVINLLRLLLLGGGLCCLLFLFISFYWHRASFENSDPSLLVVAVVLVAIWVVVAQALETCLAVVCCFYTSSYVLYFDGRQIFFILLKLHIVVYGANLWAFGLRLIEVFVAVVLGVVGSILCKVLARYQLWHKVGGVGLKYITLSPRLWLVILYRAQRITVGIATIGNDWCVVEMSTFLLLSAILLGFLVTIDYGTICRDHL